MPGNVSSRAPGTARAIARPADGRISGSSSPCTTSVGTRTARSPASLLGEPMAAASCLRGLPASAPAAAPRANARRA